MPSIPRLDDQLCFSLYGALQAITRAYKPLLDRIGLTYPQYLVMLVLWEHGAQSVKAIGERLGLDSGTLTPLLKRLEGAGLVLRRRDQADERVVRISLTASGAGLADEAVKVYDGIVCAVGWSAPEIAALRDRLKALRTSLDREA